MPLGNSLAVFPGKPVFPPITDLAGKVVLVTGGNRGIGYEVCKILLLHNATVYLGARSESKALAAVGKLKEETGKASVHFLILDLGSVVSVGAAVREFLTRESSLHILINNGAPVDAQVGERNSDGIETNVGTFVLGHHVLTVGLLPALRKAATTSDKGTVRVISVASAGLYYASPKIDADTLDKPSSTESERWPVYCRSKLVSYLWGRIMTQKYSKEGIFTYTLHPGVINTESLVNSPRFSLRIFMAIFGRPVHEGAGQVVWVATSAELKEEDAGSFYVQWMKKRKGPVKAANAEQLRCIWEWLEEKRMLLMQDQSGEKIVF